MSPHRPSRLHRGRSPASELQVRLLSRITDPMIFHKPPGISVPHGRRVLWRYLPAWKCDDLLSTSTLWFANAHTMKDHEEVTLPPALLETLNPHEQWALNPDKALTLLSCWTMLPKESCRLWKEYLGNDPNGVAIRTTVSALGRALQGGDSQTSDLFTLATVEYDISVGGSRPSRFQTVCAKNPCWSYESEVRVVILGQGLPQRCEIARRLEVNLRGLIRSVYIAPTATAEYRRRIALQFAALSSTIPLHDSACGA